MAWVLLWLLRPVRVLLLRKPLLLVLRAEATELVAYPASRRTLFPALTFRRVWACTSAARAEMSCPAVSVVLPALCRVVPMSWLLLV